MTTSEAESEPAPLPLPPLWVTLVVGVLLGPGAGHFLVRRAARGLAFAVAAMVARAGAWLLVAHAPSTTTVLLLSLNVLVHVGSVVDLAFLDRSKLSRARLVPFSLQALSMLLLDYGVRRVIFASVCAVFPLASGSMIPTFGPGDWFLASKLGAPVGRGEVIAFEPPATSSAEDTEGQAFVKRVVGVSGDIVELKAGKLHINGVAVPRCELGTMRVAGESKLVALERIDGRTHLIVDDPRAEGSWQVAAGELFVLGDHRSNSHDSRSWNQGKGAGVPSNKVLGRATFLKRGGALKLGPVDGLDLPREAVELEPRLRECLSSGALER